MKHRSLLVAISLMTLLGLLMAACAPQATQAPAATEPAAAAACTGDYYLVPKNLGNPYFDTANNG
ncbi:MAG TPA: hypothetical protein VF243_06460, partial [Nitrosospira sp.]